MVVIFKDEFPLGELAKCEVINLIIYTPIKVKSGSELKFHERLPIQYGVHFLTK